MHKPVLTLALIATLAASIPAQAGWNPLADDKASESSSADAALAIQKFKDSDPSMKVFFERAYGYAVFPTVGKGGIGIGGAYGEGTVYEQGKVVGSTTLTQVTIGLQLGGQAYSEIVFFRDKRALDDFKTGNFEFSAQASAVAVKAGSAANADYSNGVAIFTQTKGGLMYEASVGGQKFSFSGK